MNFSPADLVIIIGSIFVSMAIHEAMHAFTSHWLGDTTARDSGRLTLNPLKHIDLYTTVLLPIVLILVGAPPIFAAKPVPFNPDRVKYDEFGVALIGVAGPLTNLLLAILGAGFLRSLQLPLELSHILLVFVEINVAFFVFNMIPIPPLDGSRLLYAVAPEPIQRIMRQIESLGFVAILIIFIVIIKIFYAPIIYVESHLLRVLLGSFFNF
ncbi:MAG: site-2 protease family protein [Candidatus Saccharimonadales bacterium]